MASRMVNHVRGNAVAYAALFVALGGSAYAASSLPANSVGTSQLKNGAVTLPKVSAGTQRALRGRAGKPGPRGPSDLYYTIDYRGANGRELKHSLTLPPGQYLLNGKASFANHSAAKLDAECDLGEAAIVSAAQGGFEASEVDVPQLSYFTLDTAQWFVNLPRGGAVVLDCYFLTNDATGKAISDEVLSALKVSSTHQQR